MLRTLLVCSDGDCAVLYEAYAHDGEVDALGCDCGYGLQPLGWPETVDEPAGARLSPSLAPIHG